MAGIRRHVRHAITGEFISYFNHESGPMTGYGTGTECDDGCTGTPDEQYYLDVLYECESSIACV
jgi:hypothetical protein